MHSTSFLQSQPGFASSGHDSCTQVLHPGDVALANRGTRMETLLGSCVAIVLTDPRRTVATMCHYVHAGAPPASRPDDAAWGEAAVRAMCRKLMSVAIAPTLCEAHVFGGGNVLANEQLGADRPVDVGKRNSNWALEYLTRAGIHISSYHIGGHCYRKLRWTVSTEPECVQLTTVAMNG